MSKRELTGKKVSLYLHALTGGGAERMTIQLATHLSKQGATTHIVVAKKYGELRDAVPPEVDVVDLGSSSLISSLLPLIAYLKKHRPHVVVGGGKAANIIAVISNLARGQNSEVVVVEHNTLSIATKSSASIKERLMPVLSKIVYRRASQIVAVSNGVATDLAKTLKLDASRIKVIYNPVISEDLIRKSEEPLLHQWFNRNMPPVILAVGRLEPAKDFRTLVAAFEIVIKKTDARLLILGDGRERAKLEAQVDTLGLQKHVQISGFDRNPYRYMRNCDVFVLSSRWEGLPTVLIEALACGAKVVSTDCPSGPREIINVAEHSRLVPVGDPEALAEEILKTLARNETVSPSLENFSADKAFASYTEIIRDCLEKR